MTRSEMLALSRLINTPAQKVDADWYWLMMRDTPCLGGIRYLVYKCISVIAYIHRPGPAWYRIRVSPVARCCCFCNLCVCPPSSPFSLTFICPLSLSRVSKTPTSLPTYLRLHPSLPTSARPLPLRLVNVTRSRFPTKNLQPERARITADARFDATVDLVHEQCYTWWIDL